MAFAKSQGKRQASSENARKPHTHFVDEDLHPDSKARISNLFLNVCLACVFLLRYRIKHT